jgi:hypothetical protein
MSFSTQNFTPTIQEIMKFTNVGRMRHILGDTSKHNPNKKALAII